MAEQIGRYNGAGERRHLKERLRKERRSAEKEMIKAIRTGQDPEEVLPALGRNRELFRGYGD